MASLSTLVSPEGNDNVANAPTPTPEAGDGGTSLVIGQRAPPLSVNSDIPYLANRLRGLVIYYTEDDVPPILKDIGAKEWQDPNLLKSTFKAPSRDGKKARARKVDLIFPYALIDQAKNLTDRVVVINWWLNQTHEQMKEHWDNIKSRFSRPRVSSSPIGARVSAATAASAHELGLAYKLTGLFDSEEDRLNALKQSQSYQLLYQNQQRKAKEPPVTDRQVFDRHTLRCENQAQKNMKKTLLCSLPPPDVRPLLKAQYDLVAVVSRNVSTPEIAGRTANSEVILPKRKLQFFAPDEESLKSVLTTPLVDHFKNDAENNEFFYASADQKWPAEERAEKRKKTSIRTSDEVTTDEDTDSGE